MDIVEEVIFPAYIQPHLINRNIDEQVNDNNEQATILLGYILTAISQRMIFHMLIVSVDPEKDRHRTSIDHLTGCTQLREDSKCNQGNNFGKVRKFQSVPPLLMELPINGLFRIRIFAFESIATLVHNTVHATPRTSQVC